MWKQASGWPINFDRHHLGYSVPLLPSSFVTGILFLLYVNFMLIMWVMCEQSFFFFSSFFFLPCPISSFLGCCCRLQSLHLDFVVESFIVELSFWKLLVSKKSGTCGEKKMFYSILMLKKKISILVSKRCSCSGMWEKILAKELFGTGGCCCCCCCCWWWLRGFKKYSRNWVTILWMSLAEVCKKGVTKCLDWSVINCFETEAVDQFEAVENVSFRYCTSHYICWIS